MRHILVVVEDHSRADAAQAYAAQLARAEGATVHVMDMAQAHESGVQAIARQQPDLVVLATRHRPSVNGWFIHDLADRIVGAHVAPVVLVSAARDNRTLEGQHILVPLDGSQLAEGALSPALELARAVNSDLILFQSVPELMMAYAVPPELEQNLALDLELAWDPAPSLKAAQDYLDFTVRRLAREHLEGIQVKTIVRLGDLADQIRDLVTNEPRIGMVVMVTRGRSGFDRWLVGSSLAEVVHAVDIPVVAVPPLQHSHRAESEHVA